MARELAAHGTPRGHARWLHTAAELNGRRCAPPAFRPRAVGDLGTKKNHGCASSFFAPKSPTGEMRLWLRFLQVASHKTVLWFGWLRLLAGHHFGCYGCFCVGDAQVSGSFVGQGQEAADAAGDGVLCQWWVCQGA